MLVAPLSPKTPYRHQKNGRDNRLKTGYRAHAFHADFSTFYLHIPHFQAGNTNTLPPIPPPRTGGFFA